MYLTGLGTKPTALVTTPSPRLDEPGVLVHTKTPHYSPWRVIMLGETPGSLIESNMILNLNDPCALKDVSWIKPGKAAWNWWFGDYIPDAKFKVPNLFILAVLTLFRIIYYNHVRYNQRVRTSYKALLHHLIINK
jgi:hypothetical protein